MDEAKNLNRKFDHKRKDTIIFSTSSKGVLVVAFVFMSVITHLLTGNFYTSYTIPAFVRQATFMIIIGFAQMLVLMVGGIDLSVAGIAAFSSIAFSWLLQKAGLPFAVCLLFGMLVGALLGLINGTFISLWGIPPFIVTLCTSYFFRGVTYVVTGGAPIAGLPSSVTKYGSGVVLGFLPYPTLVMLFIGCILYVMLRYTPLGRHIYAVGGNEKAASIVGIKTGRIKMVAYALSGCISACAGILTALRIGSAQLSIGATWVMPSITAAVIGGTSMKGGIGSVIGTVLGGLFMATIGFCISVLGIASYWTDILTGCIVLATVCVDAMRTKNIGNR